MADRKRNNASWCCDRIEELLEEYKEIRDRNLDIEDRTYSAYKSVIEELEEILYGE